MRFLFLSKELFLKVFVQVLSKGGLQVKIMKTTVAVFPRVSKKRGSNNDDKHDNGQEKRRPSTLCWGKKWPPKNENNKSHQNVLWCFEIVLIISSM